MNDLNQSLQVLRQVPPELSEKQVEAIVLKLHLLPPPKYDWFSIFHINHLIVMSTLSVISLSIWLLLSSPPTKDNSQLIPLLSDAPLLESPEIIKRADASSLMLSQAKSYPKTRTDLSLQSLNPISSELKAITPKLNWSGNRTNFKLETLGTNSTQENLILKSLDDLFQDSVPSADKTKIKTAKRKSKTKMQSLKDKRKAYQQRRKKIKQRQKTRKAKQRKRSLKNKVKSTVNNSNTTSNLLETPFVPQVERRPIAAFESLEVSGLAVVYLSDGPTKDIKVDVEGMPITDLITRVEKGKLIITTQGEHNGEAIRVSVSGKNLKQITVKGAGELISQDAIKSDDLVITVAEVGAAWLELNTKNVTINMKGGDLDLSGRTATQAINWEDPDQQGTLSVHKVKSSARED
ncbi:MAG: hypothetical protein Sapg2KO_34110 [Saprospiraceae bacterium]